MKDNKYLILVNSTHPLEDDNIFAKVDVDTKYAPNRTLEIKTYEAFKKLREYAKENGFITTSQVIAISPYITTRQGASVALNRLINKGHLHMVGKGEKTIYEFIR